MLSREYLEMTDNKGSIVQKFANAGLKLGVNQGVVQVCSFARNVIMARLLTTADFGIASIFAMTYGLLEMVSNLAVETLLIQAPDGDDPPFQSTAQLLMAGRGLVNGAVILLLSKPIALLFGVPQARWAFACLALFPVMKGFAHLDASRLQRHMQFEPLILTTLVPAVATTLIAYPMGIWFRDYRAMLWLLIGQITITSVVSHFVAERRYGWSWDQRYSKRIFSFGWPLLVNGLLMYLIFQGDRFVIGAAHQILPNSKFSLADLGIYSVGFALTMAPSQLISGLTTQMFLPILSRAQNEPDRFYRRYAICAQIATLAGVLISIPFVVAGGPLVTLIYGRKYSAAVSFIGWLGAMQCLRMMRNVPTTAALAKGDTKNSMYSNIARTSAFLGILIVTATGHSLAWIAACGFFGEVLALIVCLARLQKRHSVSAGIFLRAAIVPASGLAVSSAIGYLGVQEMRWPIAVLMATGLMAVVAVAMLASHPGLREGLQSILPRPERSAAT